LIHQAHSWHHLDEDIQQTFHSGDIIRDVQNSDAQISLRPAISGVMK